MSPTGAEPLPDKPGYLTTEFWKSVIYAGLSLLTGLGVIGPSLPDKYKAVIDSAALLAGAACVFGYSISRGKTKAAAVEATASVIMQRDYLNSPSAPNAEQV